MQTLSLDGIWQLCSVGTSAEIHPAPVPGSVHDALLAASVLPDAHFGYDERDQMWVADRTWVYRRTFEADDSLLAAPAVELVCEGLDTLCTITLNGRQIGAADNMFRTWRYNIKAQLISGENELALTFAPVGPVMAAGTAARHLPAWNELANSGNWGPTGRGYVRKQACQFGWDWGMQSPSAGPWRSLRIEASAVARIDDWRVSQIHRADGAVDLTIFLQPTTGADLAVRAELHLGEMLVASTEQSFWGGWEWQLTVENPALWWPNGMGAQPLYTLTLTLCDASGQPLDSVIRRLGLRTCELVREPDEWGRSMFFKVNGRRFFAKGSNWIPLDAHPSAQNLDARYRRDLTSARDAHMNMLRVWGGGYFAHDAFYDLCDELGLLVWQDLMFGCGAYPVWDERFRDSVWHETTHNARRLRHHACLACWCGNNELELGFTAPAWEANSGTQQNVGMLAWASYLELFDRVLPSALALADPSTPYLRGSPHCAPEDGRDGNSARSGDCHLWEIWFSQAPFENYRKYPHRFLSEFGFQSFPDADLLRQFAPAGETLTADSPWLAFRQRSSPGNSRVVEKTVEWFGPVANFDRLCTLSQLLHGLGMKIGVEHWRRLFPRCGGATYWQLNDRWAAPTWATLDVRGRWKASHHIARRFFAPLAVIGIEDHDGLDVFLVNDHSEAIPGLLTVDVIGTDGRLLGSATRQLTAAPESASTPCGRFLLAELSEAMLADIVVWLRFAPEDVARPAAENQVIFTRPCKLSLAPAQLAWKLAPGSTSDTAVLTLVNGSTPALWTHVTAHPAIIHATDNFACIRPGATHTLTLTLVCGTQLETLQGTLSVSCALGHSGATGD